MSVWRDFIILKTQYFTQHHGGLMGGCPPWKTEGTSPLRWKSEGMSPHLKKIEKMCEGSLILNFLSNRKRPEIEIILNPRGTLSKGDFIQGGNKKALLPENPLSLDFTAIDLCIYYDLLCIIVYY